MLNFHNLNNCRENIRLEAKNALTGLPRSLWETYSAFANTLGGFILLGVNENKDGTLEACGLAAPDHLIKEFWDTINNQQKISVNLLSGKDVSVQKTDGGTVVVIHVPRAERSYKPVYISGNPSNCYRRNGEGDYKCTKEEFQAMIRDSSVKTQDMLILEEMDLSVFNADSVRGYRQIMKLGRPDHVWEKLADSEFLQKIGAIGIGEDGKKHPTSAGLLMFGNEYDIVREYGNYFLDYQEQYDPQNRWTDRIISSSGDWSGNLFEFFFRVYNKLQLDLKTPFKMEEIKRVDDTPVRKALREALANCLVNADYYGRRGVVIIKKQDLITIANPGLSRVETEAAVSGGISDPRNSTIMKMFNLINIGERAGSGIPNIFRVWEEQKWKRPDISESLNPDRFVLSLPLSAENTSGGNLTAEEKIGGKYDIGKKIGDNGRFREKIGGCNGDYRKIGDKKSAIKTGNRKSIVNCLIGRPGLRTAEIAEYIGLNASRTRDYLRELAAEGVIEASGANRNRTYRLKE